MSGKGNGVSQRQIQMTAAALQKLQQEQHEAINAHFNELKGEHELLAGARDLVLRATLTGVAHEDLPALDVEAEHLLNRVDVLARALAKRTMFERQVALKELVEHLHLSTLPPHIVWAAKRAGVELFPEPPAGAEATGDATPLILAP